MAQVVRVISRFMKNRVGSIKVF